MLKSNKKIIAVVGAKGFVGEAICQEIENRKDLELIRISRGDDIEDFIKDADVVIHTANPARRFIAEKNPESDFVETIQKTFKILQFCKKKKIVLISSLSARTQLNTHYGRHRKACEILVDNGVNLIIRLGPMYGGGRTQDTLHDILNNNIVYLSGATKYAYVDVAYAARKVVGLIDNTGIIEIGAKGGIALEKIKKIFGSDCFFEGYDDTQIPISPPHDAPEVKQVLQFCEVELQKLKKDMNEYI